MYKKKNFAKGTLSAQLLIGGTSLVLQSGEGAKFPAAGAGNAFVGVIWGAGFASPEADANREVVIAYLASGDTFTISRAKESSVAKQWEISDNFMLAATGAVFDEYETALLGKKNFHGIQAAGALSFDNSTHILTMASGSNIYWIQGVKFETAAAITCDLDSFVTLTANTAYYLYFDDVTGTLKASATPWDFYTMAIVAVVFWNGSAGAVQKETHDYRRCLDWHTWAHKTIGARYVSGLSLTLPTTVTDGSLQIESGSIMDEDILHTISQQTIMRGFYKASAGVYTFADYALPYLGTAGAPVFLDTDTYALSTFAAGDYAVYWVYASGDVSRPIYIVPTHASIAHVTPALARAELAPDLSGLNLNPEMKLLYKFIFAGNGQLLETADYRTSSSVPSGGSASTNASAVSFAPTGNVAATTVQAAIEELDNEKLPLAGGTLTGDVQLGETDIKLDAVLSADEKWSGIVIAATLGATIAVGDLCYLNADDSRWELVDANLSDGYDKQLGICVLAGNDGDTSEMLVYGKVRSAAFPAFTVGSPLYISETAGDMTHTQPVTTDVCIRKIGIAITAEDLLFNPESTFIIHT